MGDADGLLTLGFVWTRADPPDGWNRHLFRRYRQSRTPVWHRLTHVDADLPYCPACLSQDVTATLDGDPQWWCGDCRAAWWTLDRDLPWGQE